MKSEHDFDLFSSFEWSTLIDRYLSQYPDYENSKNLALIKITKKRKKKAGKKRLTPYSLINTKETSKQIPIFLNKACKHAIKYRISPKGASNIKSSLDLSNDSVGYFIYNFPQEPLWIELDTPTKDKIGGVFFYKFNPEYKYWFSTDEITSINTSTLKYIQQDEGKWTLEFINMQGIPIISLKYHYVFNRWEFAYPHICPSGGCHYTATIDQLATRRVKLKPCQTCHDAMEYCLSWFCTTYKLINESTKLSEAEDELTKIPPTISTLQKSQFISNPQIPKKPVIVANPLLIDHYIKHSNEKITSLIEQSHKYLWMHSAWIMTEILRENIGNIVLPLPTQSIYIELEQPRELHQQSIAAFSFLQNREYVWTLNIINNEGRVIWTAFYEKNIWVLPKNYVCPKHQCMIEKTQTDTAYLLCEPCQDLITYYTSWIITALRMVSGDFQEQVQLQKPDEVLETTMKKVPDKQTGEAKEVHILRRYQIIRYYDVCKYKGNTPQTKRGSWMSGRPFAESEFEVNLDAVIYVQIQPREHDRTFRHERFTHAKGKTKHVEPHPRLQPMTIRTFRQLKHIQKITKVYASKFESEIEGDTPTSNTKGT